MTSISNKVLVDILKTIPDFTCWDQALQWIQSKQQAAHHLDVNHMEENTESISMQWNQIEQKQETPFGFYACENWRKFILAAFLADLISYPNPIEQVTFDRMLFVMHAFPQGFRIWWLKIQGFWLPVGYTGFYPMLESHFTLFEKHPGQLKNRMVVPCHSLDGHRPYLYLFNYSIMAALKKSKLSKALMKNYMEDIKGQHALGLACITVSEDGARIANRFGMQCTGLLLLEGCAEGIYLKRFS